MKCGFVALAGLPNAGKSTLINALVAQKIAIVSEKPQTTRSEIRGIVSRPDAQIIFTDTPGIHKASNRLEERMAKETGSVLMGTDLIYLLADGTRRFDRQDEVVLSMAAKARVPVFLLLNKTDRLRKKEILDTLNFWQDKFAFAEIFPISALKQTDFSELIETTIRYLPEGEPLYPQEEITDASENFRIAEIIREKILYCTHQEVPHAAGVLVERKEKVDGTLEIDALVLIEKEGQKGILIGRRGSMLARIEGEASRDIARMLGEPVALTIFVRVESAWRNKDRTISSFGYGNIDE
jgi:GTP-binding protein Era